jgi:hypothetical protein
LKLNKINNLVLQSPYTQFKGLTATNAFSASYPRGESAEKRNKVSLFIWSLKPYFRNICKG